MKAVMLSIRPEWCQKIAAGDKTIEVRKSKPKLETPFKCYIYCTKGNVDMVPSKIWWKADSTGFQHIMNGKVIGEFVVEGECDCLNCKQCFWDLPGNSYNLESDCGLAYALMYIDELYKPLFKAPQSWCYVEDMKKDDGK